MKDYIKDAFRIKMMTWLVFCGCARHRVDV